MPLTLKIKYFNTFILREEPTVTTVKVAKATDDGEIPPVLGASNTIIVSEFKDDIVSGLIVHGPGINEEVKVTDNTILTLTDGTIGATLTVDKPQKIEKSVTLTFSNASAYPTGSNAQAANKEWHIEESRIKGGFNEKTVDFGVKAYAVDKKYNRNHRKNAMIYSGIYNSRTGINDTNQFSIGENITKAVDSVHGSIQKLYAEDTNLLIFQENKVNGALIDKDAIFTAEGGGLTTAAKVVIGQITPYLGEFGIGKNPESFAVYGFRKYFVDKDRAAVLRLSRDGITEISSYGMKSFFRNFLKRSNIIHGMFDLHSKSYVLSLQLQFKSRGLEQTFVNPISATVASNTVGKVSNVISLRVLNSIIKAGMKVNFSEEKIKSYPSYKNSVSVLSVKGRHIKVSKEINVLAGELIEFETIEDFTTEPIAPLFKFKTLAFDDKVNGWTSFLSFRPDFGGSVTNNFYTWDGADLYKHYSNDNKNTFYGNFASSLVKIISNQNPSLVKHYKTINYEGTNNWKVTSMFSPADDDNNYNAYPIPGNITGRYSDQFGVTSFAGFTPLEKKYYANVIVNDTSSITGISALTTTGVKGFFAETTLEHQPVNNNKTSNRKKHAELFSVGFNYEQSLY